MENELITTGRYPDFFEPFSGPDAAFMPLLDRGGLQMIVELDDLAMDGARQSAVRATMLYQKYAQSDKRREGTRALMAIFAEQLQVDVAAGQAAPLIPTMNQVQPPSADRTRETGA
ncbi:hypothetical protein [Cupriavidus necator]|uniref:hypothetical protein n=1 Tax=Cupriavidus necator TaxID=106590 RepID=UPI0005B32968|nr:hypothetical protein [Cupriavidus necator]